MVEITEEIKQDILYLIDTIIELDNIMSIDNSIDISINKNVVNVVNRLTKELEL